MSDDGRVWLEFFYEGVDVGIRIWLLPEEVERVFTELADPEGDALSDYVRGVDADGDAFLISRYGLRMALVEPMRK